MNKQVANELAISEVIVKMHRASVMRKLGAKSVPCSFAWARHSIAPSRYLIGSTTWNCAPLLPSDEATSSPP